MNLETIPGFCDNLLDRADYRRRDDRWIAKRLSDTSTRIVQFAADRALIDLTNPDNPQISWLAPDRLADRQGHTPVVFLGLDGDGRALFATMVAHSVQEAEGLALPDGIKQIDLRSLAVQGLLATGDIGLLSQARSMLHWHQRHRYCGACGAVTVSADAGYRRHCDSCGLDHFPRTDPVVIMAVKRGRDLLLGRGAQFDPGVYSALAGFMEPGETIEAAVRREIFEETGISVSDVQYHSSEPWPFPASLMIGMICEAGSGTLDIDHDELEDARWFSASEAMAMVEGRHHAGLRIPPPVAIASRLIRSCLYD